MLCEWRTIGRCGFRWSALGLWSVLLLVGCTESESYQTTIVFADIPAGTFVMGSPDPNEFGKASACEGPQHSVTLTRPFKISRHEVTVGQFREFVNETGYRTEAERNGLGCNGLDKDTGAVIRSPDWIWSQPGFEQTDDHPVVCVSHADAVEFCRWLSTKLDADCRLPTEAEWEYCCRAGSTTRYSTGETPNGLNGSANCGDQSLIRVFPQFAESAAQWDDGFTWTAPVGTFAPNAFGLHDLHGNVGEWCGDWFEFNYYTSTEAVDPEGPPESAATRASWHVVRGGSWFNAPPSLRSSGRHDGVPTEASTTNGFRVVID